MECVVIPTPQLRRVDIIRKGQHVVSLNGLVFRHRQHKGFSGRKVVTGPNIDRYSAVIMQVPMMFIQLA